MILTCFESSVYVINFILQHDDIFYNLRLVVFASLVIWIIILIIISVSVERQNWHATNTIWTVGKLHDLIRSCFIVLDAWHFKGCYCLYYIGVCLKHWRKRKMEIKTNIPFIYMSLGLCLEALLVLRFTEPFPSYSLKPTIRRLFKEILSQSLNIQINISYTFAWGRLDGRMNGQNNFKQPYDLIKLSLVT